MKKIILCLLVMVCLLGLVGCGQKEKPADIIKDGRQATVGIIKYITTPALDNAQNGIIQGLEEAGYKDGEKIVIKTYNPEGDASKLSQIVETAVHDCDLIFAIATPVAAAVKAEVESTGLDVPVFFTAVTDPVTDGIVASNENTGANISGTSDMNPVADQLDLISDIAPNAKKVGYLYTSSESNSIIQLNLLKAHADELGLEVVAKSISKITDLKTATEALVAENIDVVYLPTDNLVNTGAKTVLDITNNKKIPSICAEEGYLSNGGTITLSIDYTKLGNVTAKMAAKVLSGEVEDASKLAVQRLEEFNLRVNIETAEEYGIVISDELKAKLNN